MDIETYIKICTFREAWKAPSLHHHVMVRSEHTEEELYISETSVDYPEEHFYDQSKIVHHRKGMKISSSVLRLQSIIIRTVIMMERNLKTMLLLILIIFTG